MSGITKRFRINVDAPVRRGICISGRWFYRLVQIAVQQDDMEADRLLVLDGLGPVMGAIHKKVQVST